MKKLALVPLILVLFGCGGLLGPKNVPPNTTINAVGTTAVYGRQFIAAGQGVLRGLDTAMGAGILPTEYGVPILRVIKLVGEESVRLADILAVVDSATDAASRASAMARARAIVSGMQSLVTNSTIPITDAKAKALVTSVLATLVAILGTFDIGLPTAANLGLEADTFRTAPAVWSLEVAWAQQY